MLLAAFAKDTAVFFLPEQCSFSLISAEVGGRHFEVVKYVVTLHECQKV